MIYYQNIRSIPAKKDVKVRIATTSYEILCFTETWFKSKHNNDSYFPPIFDVYRNDRTSMDRAGGVAILVAKKFNSKELKDVSDPDCDCIAVRIPFAQSPLIIYVAYVPQWQQADNTCYMKHYNLIKKLCTNYVNHRIIVVGDWNLADIKWKLDASESYYLTTNTITHRDSNYFNIATEFLQKLHQLPLYQMSNFKNISGNVLDLVFVREFANINVCKAPIAVTEIDKTDMFHPPLEISFNAIPPEQHLASDEFIDVCCYNQGNYERLSQQLEAINFAHEFNRLNVDDAFDFYYSKLTSLIESNIPKKRIKTKKNKPIWWTSELQRLKNRRDKLFKRKPKGVITNEYTQALLDFNLLQDELYNKHINNIEKNIVSNPKQFWNYIKDHNGTSSYPSEMFFKDESAETPLGIVNLFSKYFEQMYDTDNIDTNIDEIYNEEPNETIDINLTLFDIDCAIARLKSKACIGPDGLHPKVIKECADSLVFPIWLLFTKTLDNSRIPDKLKVSRVIALFKKGNRKNVENYRIIAINSILMKIFEIAVLNKLRLSINCKLSNAQHGFRSGRSVTTNLINLSVSAYEALQNGNQLDIFYGDFKNAFDRVCHRLLVKKLHNFNVSKRSSKWIYEFLSNRTNYVQIGNNKSRLYSSNSGVPAGSTLGPLLFLIFINDIVDVVEHATVLMFADDIKIQIEVKTSTEVFKLQSDINNLLSWCNTNRLYFNNDKCAVITIRRSHNFINAVYKLSNHTIERKDS